MLEFGIVLHSLIVGFMLFFMVVVTPSVFSGLNEEEAGNFLRIVFPRMFLYGLVASILASIIFLVISSTIFYIISIISAVFFSINLFYINPTINKFRDEFKSGVLEAEKKFKLFHSFSVTLFLLQLIGSIFILYIYYY